MGLLHHANYFVYFEMGRTELLRQRGLTYREIEDAGHYLVIIDIGCKFKRPAYYDDLLTLENHGGARSPTSRSFTITSSSATASLLAEGHTTLACVDKRRQAAAAAGLLR